MNEVDEEHTIFIMNEELYCYKVMPFGLKNAGATYQRLVNKMFVKQLGKLWRCTLMIMLVKSKKAIDHSTDLEEMFQILREYKMKLNPTKCAFGVSFGKFPGFIVNNRGIEVNPNKIQALINMRSPQTDQFESQHFKFFCSELGIQKSYSAVGYP